MTVTKYQLYPVVPLFWRDAEEHIRKSSQALNGALDGQTNNTFDVTLEADVTSTVIIDSRISRNSMVLLSPKSAAAAADLSSMWSEATAGQLTIHHPSSGAADRDLGVVICG